MIAESQRGMALLAARVMAPPPDRTADIWAEAAGRRLPAGSAEQGQIHLARTPYVVPIARAHAMWGLRTIAYVMARQMAKTQGVIFNEVGRRLDDCPVPMMYIGTTELFVRSKIEPKVTDMLRTTPTLREKTSWGHGSSKYVKTVNGVQFKLAWAGSDAMMQGDENGAVFVDEVDRVEAERPKATEGTVVGMAEATTSTYPDSLMSLTSTPTLGLAVPYQHPDTGLWHWAEPEDMTEVISGIWRYWLQGTRHEWSLPCPDCRVYFIPRSNLIGPVGEDVTPAQANRDGYVTCPACGSQISDTRRAWMNDRGVMVQPACKPLDYDDSMGCYSEGGLGPVLLDYNASRTLVERNLGWGDAYIEPGTTDASFWVSGIASFSSKKTFGFLASQMVKAQRKRDPQAEQAVHNIEFGEIYQRRGDAPDWDAVKTLAADYAMGTVPREVTTLTLGADVSADCIQYVIRGWIPDGDLGSRLIACGEFWGDTEAAQTWDRFWREVVSVEYDGLPVTFAVVDSGYRKQQVYEFCAEHQPMVLPTKGRDDMDRRWSPSLIELDWRGRADPTGLTLWHLNTDVTKSWVHARTRRPVDQPGAWLLPHDIHDEYCKQIAAESRAVKPNGKPEWIKHRANHWLDCEAGAYFAAEQIQILAERPGRARTTVELPPAPGPFGPDD
jgi:phage terminase large subunit GpA-like protein